MSLRNSAFDHSLQAAGAGYNQGPDYTRQRQMTIGDLLLENRIIFLDGVIHDGSANLIVMKLLYLQSENRHQDIHLYVNSPGGSVTATMAIYDTMQYIDCSVATYCVGLAASGGAILVAGGSKGKRHALPHAKMMIHQPFGEVGGQVSDIEIQAQEILNTREQLNEVLAQHTGQPLDRIAKDTDRDFYMSAEEAKEYGLVDEVLAKEGKEDADDSDKPAVESSDCPRQPSHSPQTTYFNKHPVPSDVAMTIPIPYVIERHGREERAMDIYSRLLKDRIIILGSGINDTVSNSIVAQLLFLQFDDGESDIHMYINSPGGSITSGMAIYDTMQYIGCDVSTYCIGQASSMGAILLAAGTAGKRNALPNSRIMIHQPLAGMEGTDTDLEIHAREVLKVKQRMNEILLSHTGQTLEQIEQDTDRDNFMTAEEAQSYGLIDNVLEHLAHEGVATSTDDD